MTRLLLVTLLVILSFNSAPVFSCASCGSGGDSPLVLFPGEDKKIYLGFTNSEVGDYFDKDGQEADYFGIESKNTITAAFAYRVFDDVFTTLTLNAQQNKEMLGEALGVSDPLLSFYYVASKQNFLEPFKPQVSIIAQYKPAYAKSNEDIDWANESSKDVFSDGLNEFRLGIDSWFFTNNFLYGLAFKANLYTETSTLQGSFQRDSGYKAIATGGYVIGNYSKLIGGYTYTKKGAMIRDRVLVKDSEMKDQSLFISWYQKLDIQNLLRLTYSENALFRTKSFVNNTKNLSVGYMYLW